MKKCENIIPRDIPRDKLVVLLAAAVVLILLLVIILVFDPFGCIGRDTDSGSRVDISDVTTGSDIVPEGGSEVESYTDPATGEEVITAEMITDPDAPVTVSAERYEFTYTSNMSELISIRKLNETDLEFIVQLDSGKVTFLTMRYGTAEGDLVIERASPEGEMVSIAFGIPNPPEDLTDWDLFVFRASQEMVNEIMNTLTLK